MSFILPDLVVESVIRDGLANLVNNPTIIDNIFASLTRNYAMKKYGNNELIRIKNYIAKKQIKVVHSFNLVDMNVPCFSIQLGQDMEDKKLARLDDLDGETIDYFEEDSEEYQDTILVVNKTPVSYDTNSGKLIFDSSVDLSEVTKNKKYVNADGEFVIVGPVLKDTEKAIFLEKGLDIDVSKPGSILSQLNYTQTEERGVHSDVQLLIGVHTKDALTTKYLYVLLKYFILSRKESEENRGFILGSYSGSDFTRDMKIKGDIVYTRFLTVSGKTEDSWNGDEVELFDDLQVTVGVPKDEATTEDLDKTGDSIIVSETEC